MLFFLYEDLKISKLASVVQEGKYCEKLFIIVLRMFHCSATLFCWQQRNGNNNWSAVTTFPWNLSLYQHTMFVRILITLQRFPSTSTPVIISYGASLYDFCFSRERLKLLILMMKRLCICLSFSQRHPQVYSKDFSGLYEE